MRKLGLELGERSYPILIGTDLLQAKHFKDIIASKQVLIVSNTSIAPLYLSKLQACLPECVAKSFVLPDGEAHKRLEAVDEIITTLLENRFDRTSCLIALGGGVVGDITGFAAACYQRGIDYVQVPTSLLAQVDSSVGGKTAVNHALGKNMIGAFHQPLAVIADIGVLKTLPARELSAGLAEVIKYGLIRDQAFFLWLETNIEKLLALQPEALEYAIERSCLNKAEVVAQDEKEAGLRATLNLGHTFAHAIETAMHYEGCLHGEAVGIGMLMAADLSCRLGMLAQQDVARIKALLQRAALPTQVPESLPASDLRALMAVDKKSRAGRLVLILLRGIGEAVLSADVSDDALAAVLQSYTQRGST